ncbi:interferon gamma receptor 1 [Vipera latastei]
MRVAGPWLVLALLGWSLCSGLNAREPQTEVPSPKNVTVKLYNNNISVYWDNGSPSLEPLFTVQMKCYSTAVYKEIDTCINIKQHYCDLTNKTDNCETFWVGVKALSGQHQSEYVEKKFDVLRDGQIGPPKFNLSIDGQDIVVDIEPPLFPYGNLIERFTYKLFIWEKGHPEERQEVVSDDWYLEPSSTLPLSVPLDTSYCISAQVFSSALTKVGEESEEKCISPTPTSRLGFTLTLCFGIIALVTLVIILAVVFIKLQERRIKLPKSLVTVVRNQVSNTEYKPECKYDIITSTSYKPMVTCEDEKPVEKSDVTEKVKIVDANYSKEVDIDGSQGIQSARSVQEDMAVEISENEQIYEDNVTDYSKSITGQDACPDLQNLDLPRADVQKPTVLRCSIKPSGYDKPHWVDVSSGEEF